MRISKILFFIMFSFQAFAAENENNTGYSFGLITQTQQNSTIYIEQDGTLSSITGAIQSGNVSSGSISLSSSVTGFNHFERVTIPATQLDFPISIDNCTAILTVDVTDLETTILGRSGNWCGLQTHIVENFGGNLKISDGFCKAGTYSGTVKIPQISENCTSSGLVCNTSNPNCSTLADSTFDLHYEFTIQQIISIEKSGDLNFGAIFSPQSQATVTIDTNGLRTVASASAYNASKYAPSAGTFTITSKAENVPATISLPSYATISNGSNSLQISNFTAQYAGSGVLNNNSSFTISYGNQTLYIGGKLTIPAETPAGDYSGTYTITISY